MEKARKSIMQDDRNPGFFHQILRGANSGLNSDKKKMNKRLGGSDDSKVVDRGLGNDCD